MEKKLWPRVTLLIVLLVFAVASLMPSLVSKDSLPSWFSSYFDKQILKGLDLAGGVYLEYHVELDEAKEDKMERIGGDIRSRILEKLRKRFKLPKDEMLEGALRIDAKGDELTLRLKGRYRVGASYAKKAAEDAGYLDTRTPTIEFITISSTRGFIKARMDSDYGEKLENDALTQARETIQGRVDEFGVSGADVMRREDSIIVELPGLSGDYIKRVKARLGAAARLEFKIVDDESPHMQRVAEMFYRLKTPKNRGQLPQEVLEEFMDRSGKGWTFKAAYKALDDKNIVVDYDQRADKNNRTVNEYFIRFPAKYKEVMQNFFERLQLSPALVKYRLPSNREIGYGEDESKAKKAKSKSERQTLPLRTYYLTRVAGVTGEYLDDARQDYDQNGRPIVAFRFGRAGETKFRALTSKNVKRKMAIILDNMVKSAPVIQTEIGARGQITLGSFKDRQTLQQEAKDLASILKAGSLPAPMSLEFEQQVGPKLGKDAIQLGTLALEIGAVLVILFMLVYYRTAGLVAIIALVLNLVFILAILAAAEARLTLPGIAGIVLTVGMAVDANVIIFERIREELRLGKTARAAIDAGYARAFWTIIDAQVTTAIAAFVLMQYGSGPIKGFAVTLLIGIVCSVYTGVFVTRLLYDIAMRRFKMETLSI